MREGRKWESRKGEKEEGGEGRRREERCHPCGAKKLKIDRSNLNTGVCAARILPTFVRCRCSEGR